MATRITNGSYKVKAGSVKSVEGLVPEAGALVFDEEAQVAKIADGYNWATIKGDLSSIIILLVTQSDQVLTADTPEALTYFDTIYNVLEDGITPVIVGQTITFNADMLADSNIQFNVSCDVRDTTLTFEILKNGALSHTRVLGSGNKDIFQAVDWSSRAAYLSGDVVTFRITASVGCTISMNTVKMGVQQVY